MARCDQCQEEMVEMSSEESGGELGDRTRRDWTQEKVKLRRIHTP